MPATALVGAALALLLVLPRAASAEATLAGGVDQTLVYDSSPRLAATRTQTVTGYVLQPDAALTFAGAGWQVRNALSLVFPLYDNEAFNLEEQRLDVTAEYVTERDRFDLLATYDRGSTLTADFINDIDELVASRRILASLRPEWTRRVTARDRITLGASFTDVEFESSGFTDYTVSGADATWQHDVNERWSVLVTGFVSRFDGAPFTSRGISSESLSDTLGLQVGATYAFSRTLTGLLRVGARDVTTDRTDFPVGFPDLAVDSESDSTGLVFDASLDQDRERVEWSFGVSRALSPSGLGQLVEQDEVRLRVRHRTTERLSLLLRTSWLSRESFAASGLPSNFERDVFRIEPSARWRVSQRWVLGAGVRWATVDNANFAGTDGTRAFLNLRYDFGPMRVFR